MIPVIPPTMVQRHVSGLSGYERVLGVLIPLRRAAVHHFPKHSGERARQRMLRKIARRNLRVVRGIDSRGVQS